MQKIAQGILHASVLDSESFWEKKSHTGYLTFEIGPHGVLTQSLYPNTECLWHVNNIMGRDLPDL